MLDILESKRLYCRAFCDFFGPDFNAGGDGEYDAVVICGGFSKQHLPVSCLHDVLRMLKPGKVWQFQVE